MPNKEPSSYQSSFILYVQEEMKIGIYGPVFNVSVQNELENRYLRPCSYNNESNYIKHKRSFFLRHVRIILEHFEASLPCLSSTKERSICRTQLPYPIHLQTPLLPLVLPSFPVRRQSKRNPAPHRGRRPHSSSQTSALAQKLMKSMLNHYTH